MSDLLINSLEITGYRTFRHLEIPKLGRVNLIVGKNNVGKTALLEALWLFVESGDINTVRSILQARDELPIVNDSPDDVVIREVPWEVRNLFHSRKNIRKEEASFRMQANNDSSTELVVSIQWVHIAYLPNGEIAYGDISNLANVNDSDSPFLKSTINGERIHQYQLEALYGNAKSERTTFKYIPAAGLKRKDISDLWDEIALTDEEEMVLGSLRLLLPNVQRLNFLAKGDAENARIPFIKTKEFTEPIHLRSAGEGTVRLLGLSMALASTQDGLLLVDEIESGFHYSILPKVWKLIFETAAKLNVQVFATTHSWDCIEAFQRANSFQNNAEGMLIRLEAKPDKTKVTTFDKESLAIVTREQIEVR